MSFQAACRLKTAYTDVMDYETAKKNLTRFEKEGIIRRVMRGIYDKPRYSNLLQENAVPNPEEVAKAIAKIITGQ
jgi:hypothetical protein